MRFLLLLTIFLTNIYADSFDKLLEQIRIDTQNELKIDKQRKADFLEANENQKTLLKKAKTELKRLQEESVKLQKNIDTNEQKIAKEEERLQRKMGDLGELFGVVRQISGELKATYEQSMVSIHYPNRVDFLQNLSKTKELPQINELEKMWITALVELDGSRKILKFSGDVIQKDGTKKAQDIIQIGVYGAVSGNEFLTYSPTSNSFEKVLKQPADRYVNSIKNFNNPQDGFVKVMIDPTRGQLLDMLTQKPTLQERIAQGGIVGYIIIALGIIGLIIAILKYIYLSSICLKIKKQIKKIDTPSSKNPLGRIALVYEKVKEKTHEEKESAIEEAILKELPRIESFNPLLKLLAAVSPLLGLLGTVTGMIITFQAITLFGTGDPKLMAGGISTALVTTVLGLSVAIPLLFAYTFITSRTKSILDILEHQSVGLIAKGYK